MKANFSFLTCSSNGYEILHNLVEQSSTSKNLGVKGQKIGCLKGIKSVQSGIMRTSTRFAGRRYESRILRRTRYSPDRKFMAFR